jgi:hypothetical protein
MMTAAANALPEADDERVPRGPAVFQSGDGTIHATPIDLVAVTELGDKIQPGPAVITPTRT